MGGPDGGTVLKSIVNLVTPSTLYACAYGGVYKSTDAGASWSLSLPMDFQPLDAAIEPENPNTVYVTDNYIFKTTDGGNTWTELDNGIGMVGGAQDDILAVSVDPLTDGTAYAVGLKTGLYKTINGGQSWSTINNSLASLISSNTHFGNIVVDPANPQVLYVTAAFSNDSSVDGIYKSTNGGSSWAASITNVSVSQVLVDPNNDAHLFAVINFQVYASTDSGATWNALAQSPTYVQILRINPQNSQNLIAGNYVGEIYYTIDGGSSWTLGVDNPTLYIEDIAVDPATPANLYVSTESFGLYKSTDGGQTVTESDTGLHAVSGFRNMVMGSDGTIYADSILSGVFKSTDQGVYWSAVNNGFGQINSVVVYALQENPQTPATLYAGTENGLFKTTDGGANWTLLNNGITDPDTYSVAVDPENTNIVYAGTYSGLVFKSMDGGSTWQPGSNGLPSDTILSLAVDPTNSNVVFAGTITHGLYRSTNGGSSWSSNNNGLPTAAVIDAITPDFANGQTVYLSSVSSTGTIFKTTNGGNNWANASTGILPPDYYQFLCLIMDPTRSATLYAAPAGGLGNAFVTTDAGTDWQQIPQVGLPNSTVAVMVSAVAVDPNNPHNLYGMANDGQIYEFTSQAPTAKPGSVSTNTNAGVDGQLSGQLNGFTGVLNFDIVTPPSHGTVTITNAATGSFSYAPAIGFSGSDSFSFTVAAAGAVSAPATESITVNPQPQNPPPPSSGGGGGGALSLWTLLLLASLAVRRSRLH